MGLLNKWAIGIDGLLYVEASSEEDARKQAEELCDDLATAGLVSIRIMVADKVTHYE